jgi:putative acetyltransferase
MVYMSDIYQPGPALYPQLVKIWEAAVRKTHHFLLMEDILYYKSLVATYLPGMELYCMNHNGVVAGFMGLSDGMVQALFIHPDASGNGLGTRLMRFAIDEKQILRVDVNEQNEAALGFYQHLGFVVNGRTELDSSGRPYPVLLLHIPQ